MAASSRASTLTRLVIAGMRQPGSGVRRVHYAAHRCRPGFPRNPRAIQRWADTPANPRLIARLLVRCDKIRRWRTRDARLRRVVDGRRSQSSASAAARSEEDNDVMTAGPHHPPLVAQQADALDRRGALAALPATADERRLACIPSGSSRGYPRWQRRCSQAGADARLLPPIGSVPHSSASRHAH